MKIKYDNVALGADIGGSHITTGLVDLGNGRLLEDTVVRTPVQSDGSADEILNAWSAALRRSCQGRAVPQRVGLAMPGPFDYEKGISWMKGMGKYEKLYGVDVREALAMRLNTAPENILFKNDAACFLQGELLALSGETPGRVLGFTLGTGFGSAYAVGGVAEDAELWRTPFGESIAENHFSTRWFVSQYESRTGKTATGVAELYHMASVDLKVGQLFEEFGYNLSSFLNSIIQQLTCDTIIIGGNIAKASDLFWPILESEFGAPNGIALAPCRLGEMAPIWGAASLHAMANVSNSI
ncbi:ROK family protein [Parapedobacter tibetensis]|uniref:ROK family protein n=1 Tax=Parapedobacter tibetensis TaxID=2972951 RepID=UPI00214D4490|nr:ROK family protein [Parapedobacter tibetensis]